MNLDAQKVLDVFESIESELVIAEKIAYHDETKEILNQRLHMLQRLRNTIFTPEVLDAWEHEAGRGEGWTKAGNDLTEDF